MTVTYDAAGRRIAETDALNHTTLYIYDELGRVTETRFHDGTRISVGYDAAGRCTSVTNLEGQVTEYRDDSFGRLILGERVEVEYLNREALMYPLPLAQFFEI